MLIPLSSGEKRCCSGSLMTLISALSTLFFMRQGVQGVSLYCVGKGAILRWRAKAQSAECREKEGSRVGEWAELDDKGCREENRNL